MRESLRQRERETERDKGGARTAPVCAEKGKKSAAARGIRSSGWNYTSVPHYIDISERELSACLALSLPCACVYRAGSCML